MGLFGISQEERLLRMFGKGDPRAMQELCAQYAPYLSGVASRYVPGDDDLHDVLQESLIKIFTSIGSFEYRGKGSLKAWMARITVNEALHFLRKQQNSIFVDQPVDNLNVPDDDDEPPDPSALTDEQLRRLIGQLPPGYRAVLNLYAIEGKSHKQIARMLGIKPDTSASQYHKAKVMLARLIKQEIKKAS